MKAPKFVLVATGHITQHPKMNIVIGNTEMEFVRQECERYCAMLAKAGYNGFFLYDVSGESGAADLYVETYYVSIPEPIFTIKDN